MYTDAFDLLAFGPFLTSVGITVQTDGKEIPFYLCAK